MFVRLEYKYFYAVLEAAAASVKSDPMETSTTTAETEEAFQVTANASRFFTSLMHSYKVGLGLRGRVFQQPLEKRRPLEKRQLLKKHQPEQLRVRHCTTSIEAAVSFAGVVQFVILRSSSSLPVVAWRLPIGLDTTSWCKGVAVLADATMTAFALEDDLSSTLPPDCGRGR